MTSEQAKQLRALADRVTQRADDYTAAFLGSRFRIEDGDINYVTKLLNLAACLRVHASLIDDTGEGRS